MHQIAHSTGPPDLGSGVRARRGRDPRTTAATADAVVPDEIAARALEIAYRTALGLTWDPHLAADIAQDVAIKAAGRAATLRDPDALGAWLHRTTVRTAIDQHRKTQRRRIAESGFTATAPVAHTDDHGDQDVLALLAGLPDRQRAAMTLRHVHDLSDRQIAHALGCRAGTARSLLARATATLRARLTTAPATKDLR